MLMKKLDIFPKAQNTELRVKTKTGGILTIILILFFVIFTIIDFKKYLQSKTILSLSVGNEPFPSTMKIHVDMYVYNKCSSLHVDFTNQKRTFNLSTNAQQKFQQQTDRCHIIIDAEPPTVPGSMHIGLGSNYYGNNKHQHSYLTLNNMNLSHIIKKLEIGDFSTFSSLDDSSLILPKNNLYMINYDMQLVSVLADDQYSYQVLADLSKTNLDRHRNSNGLPGIFFAWNFSPLQLKKVTQYGSFVTFLSKILALFGAFFVFIRWYDRFLYIITFKKD